MPPSSSLWATIAIASHNKLIWVILTEFVVHRCFLKSFSFSWQSAAFSAVRLHTNQCPNNTSTLITQYSACLSGRRHNPVCHSLFYNFIFLVFLIIILTNGKHHILWNSKLCHIGVLPSASSCRSAPSRKHSFLWKQSLLLFIYYCILLLSLWLAQLSQSNQTSNKTGWDPHSTSPSSSALWTAAHTWTKIAVCAPHVR